MHTQNSKIKLAISNIAWSENQDIEMYEYLSSNKFDGIEIAPTRIFPEKPYENLELARKFSLNIKQKYNLQICSMQSILFGKTERLFGSEEERKILFDYVKKAIDFANAIECPNLVFGSPKNRVIEKQEQYKIGVEFFKQLGDYASTKGTTLSIEPNPTIYNTNYINSTKDAVQLIKDVNSSGFRINADLGTIIQNKETLNSVIKNINLVNHVHISEPNLDLIQQRKLHADLAIGLKKNNYTNFVSVEMKNINNLNSVKEILNYVKGVFNAN